MARTCEYPVFAWNLFAVRLVSRGRKPTSPAPSCYAKKWRTSRKPPYISRITHKTENQPASSTVSTISLFHLIQVTRQCKTIQTMKPEMVTIWLEQILFESSSKQATIDMRDQPLAIQVEGQPDSTGSANRCDHQAPGRIWIKSFISEY